MFYTQFIFSLLGVVMKRWIYGVVCSVVIVLIGTSFTVAAETVTDPTGDVWHHPNNGTEGSWSGTVTNKPNIDITQIFGTVKGKQLIINLTVAGTIQYSSQVDYWAYCNTTYMSCNMNWVNGVGYGSVFDKYGGVNSNVTFTVSGNKLSAVFYIYNGSTTIVDLWGKVAEYVQVGPGATTREWWGDWAPDSKIPFNTTQNGNPGTNPGNTNNGNTSSGNNAGKKTPGFEVLPVIAAVAIATILLRRRR